MKYQTRHFRQQNGATLIEVLVAILILSFGLLSLGAMLSYSVQLPKLSGHKMIATNIASDYIERIRANPGEFTSGTYTVVSNYNGSFDPVDLDECVFPNCTASTLAAMDTAAAKNAARALLPAGGLMVNCDGGNCASTNAFSNLWIIWQEPSTSAVLNAANSDTCPTEVTEAHYGPAPRCLYLRFKV